MTINPAGQPENQEAIQTPEPKEEPVHPSAIPDEEETESEDEEEKEED
jgi:hypothetical protein